MQPILHRRCRTFPSVSGSQHDPASRLLALCPLRARLRHEALPRVLYTGEYTAHVHTEVRTRLQNPNGIALKFELIGRISV